ncbi:MAG: PepSY-associated TM helix domain-containing protein [Cellvibrio sp.]
MAKFSLGNARTWHWVSSAICLVGMILFAVTGITLNHASAIKTEPVVTEKEAVLPESLLADIASEDLNAIPQTVALWIKENLSVKVAHAKAEISEDEIYISLPRAGGDAWMTIDRTSGDLYYEDTDRGIISFFNDLHKGRNTGTAWMWFLDAFAIACLIFSFTGLWLLIKHGKTRPTTWPLVSLGVLLPWLIILLLMH